MSWIRFSDDFLDDPAVLSIDPAEVAPALLEYHRLVAWSAKQLTDGELPVGAMRRADPTAIAALLRVGLVEPRDGGAGFLPRFLDREDEDGEIVFGHHPSRAFVEDRRKKRAEAGRLGGKASGQARRQPRAEANGEAIAVAHSNPRPRTPSPYPDSPIPLPSRRARGARTDEERYSADV